MKILVVSDTHRKYSKLKEVIDRNRDADLIIHLGDGLSEAWRLSDENPELNFVYVRGNCDACDYIDEGVIEVAEHKLFFTHGHNYYVRSGTDRLFERAKLLECTIALYGHTHISDVKCIDGVHIMNPGSVAAPRGGDGASYGIITINDGKVEMEICDA